VGGQEFVGLALQLVAVADLGRGQGVGQGVLDEVDATVVPAAYAPDDLQQAADQDQQ